MIDQSQKENLRRVLDKIKNHRGLGQPLLSTIKKANIQAQSVYRLRKKKPHREHADGASFNQSFFDYIIYLAR
jgi:hypothetical protein